jgi:iron(III) transport system substrate-binding protein
MLKSRTPGRIYEQRSIARRRGSSKIVPQETGGGNMPVSTMSRRAFALGGAGAALCEGSCGLSSAWAAGDPPAQPTDQALIAAAKAEGAVSTYGASSIVAVKSDADGFQNAYGIPVAYTQITSAPLTARVEQEIKAGAITVDVITTADKTALDRWVAAGHIATLPHLNFPRQTDHLAQIQAVYQALFYNTSAVAGPDIPKLWSDVLDSRFTEKIVLGTPRIAPGYSELYYALLKHPGYGEPFFEKLAKQKPRVVQSPVLVAQSVASGEAALGFTGLPYEAVNIADRNPGAPIAYTYLDVVTGAYTFVAINAKAPHPNAAKLFASWMMSPAGQVAHNGDRRASSLLGDLPGTLEAPDLNRIDPTTAEMVVANYETLTSLFDRLYG